jgi:hypothetical protein
VFGRMLDAVHGIVFLVPILAAGCVNDHVGDGDRIAHRPRRGFRRWWAWKSRWCMGRRAGGRPHADWHDGAGEPALRARRRFMAKLKVGIDVCQATVATYMGRRRLPRSQTRPPRLRDSPSGFALRTAIRGPDYQLDGVAANQTTSPI